MKWIVIWGILAALVAGGLIYTHAGWLTLAIAFLAWLGGIASLLSLQTLAYMQLEARNEDG